MGAPKIKIYQLPAGYAGDGDTDVQQSINDELVPLRDKPSTPDEYYLLKGVDFLESETMVPVNISQGQNSSVLTSDNSEFQTPISGHSDIINLMDSAFAPVVFNSSSTIIAPSGYQATPSGIRFLHAPFPSGASIRYWRSDALPASTFTGRQKDWYDGTNHMFKAVIRSEGAVVSRADYTMAAPSGCITFSTPVENAPVASYTYSKETTKYFIGDRENWIEGHVYMNPDVFKGMKDYPGDDTEDTGGVPIIQGPIPQYVEQGNYSIDFRRGLVSFPAEFNSTTFKVHASFACLVGIRNVTNQTLAPMPPSGGVYAYGVPPDPQYPTASGSRWVGRNDSYTMTNVYVNGFLKPEIITVSPFDVLTVKKS
jgi:hypothetical protein